MRKENHVPHQRARTRPWQTLLESSLAPMGGRGTSPSLSGKWQPDQQSGTLDNVSRKGLSVGRAFSVGSPTLRHSALMLFPFPAENYRAGNALVMGEASGKKSGRAGIWAKNYIHKMEFRSIYPRF